MGAEQMGLGWDPYKVSVDPVATGPRKTTRPRVRGERSWRKLNGGAFHYGDKDIGTSAELRLCRDSKI